MRLRVHVLSVCLDKRIDESVNKQRHRNFIENCMSLLNQMLTFPEPCYEFLVLTPQGHSAKLNMTKMVL